MFLTSNYNRDAAILTSNEIFKSEKYFVPEKLANTGESVAKLRCQVKQDNVQVNWLKDEHLINTASPSKYSTVERGNERMLIVNDVHSNDEGEYVCQSGKYRVTLFLNVNENEGMQSEALFRPSSSLVDEASDREEVELYFPDDHSFLKHKRQSSKLVEPVHRFASVKDIYINEGVRNAELKCKVVNEKAQVGWFKNEQNLETNSKYEIFSRGNERILLIKNPTTLDDGDYVCKSGRHKVVLNLNVNPHNGGITPHMYSSVDDSIFLKNAHKEPELVYYENQSATLKCQTKYENEKCIWLKENSCLPPNDPKYKTVQDGPFRLLHINNVSSSDGGNYSCQSQKDKTSHVSFKLNIKGKI